MVTNYGGTGDLMCSSTDVKPTDVAVNTRCLELDTGKFWYFNGTSWTETPGGGGGGSATLIEKSVTANGTYTASDDDADGYSSVDVNVPNTYTVDDNGKVVSNQTLVAQTAKPDTITVNDTYNTTEYNSVTVNVPNTYTAADEGKVVSSGALVAQSAYPSTITANDTYDTTLYNSVTVNVPTGGGVTEKDVNFYDYDGTLVYSYTAQEFLALSELPTTPVHTGLTAQGWNWTLADAKTYVTANGKLDVGQNYVTYDGKTRFYIDISNILVNVSISARLNGTGSVTIDWGDGTTSDTVTLTGSVVTIPHTYTTIGHYCISYSITSGTDITCYNLICTDDSNWNRVVDKCIYKVEYGTNVVIAHDSFYNVDTVNIPRSCKFSANAFADSESLKCLVMPYELLAGDFSQSANFVSLHKLILSDGYSGALSYTLQSSLLTRVICPSTQQYIGNGAFLNCKKLKMVIMPNVTLIYGNAFENCIMLDDVVIANSTTQMRAEVFKGCLTLTNIQIPASVTTIQSDTFRNCVALKTITINKPEGSISGAPWGATNATVVWTG